MDSTLATKLVNRMMKGGNKATCEAILRRTLQHIHRKTKQPPMQVVFQAYQVRARQCTRSVADPCLRPQNAKPALENKDKRMGYKVVKIPTPVEPERGINIATKWFIESAREVRCVLLSGSVCSLRC